MYVNGAATAVHVQPQFGWICRRRPSSAMLRNSGSTRTGARRSAPVAITSASNYRLMTWPEYRQRSVTSIFFSTFLGGEQGSRCNLQRPVRNPPLQHRCSLRSNPQAVAVPIRPKVPHQTTLFHRWQGGPNRGPIPRSAHSQVPPRARPRDSTPGKFRGSSSSVAALVGPLSPSPAYGCKQCVLVGTRIQSAP